ncbi:MAG TPA: hypothetical protein DCZ10_15925 [Pelotomaculum sp.]|nr:hypothetical protein [Pelotomaculum sp.]
MPSQLPPFSLRVPEPLLNKLRKIAEANKRSTNKEIEFLIEKHVQEYEKEHGPIQPP